jgi:hypothetical protein
MSEQTAAIGTSSDDAWAGSMKGTATATLKRNPAEVNGMKVENSD